MYRLLATDIDDTILARDGTFPDANRRALTALHDRGVVVVFSSGRATVSMRTVIRDLIGLEKDEYLISFNGARVVSALSDEVLYEHYIPRDVIAEIEAYTVEHGLLLQGYTDEAFVAAPGDARRRSLAERYAVSASMAWEAVASVTDTLPRGSAKLLIIDEHDVLVRHREALSALSGGRFETVFSKPHYLEIVASGVNKGDALSTLARHLTIPIEQTIAIGDGLNDCEMVSVAGTGVAVANAHDELKDASDVVLTRNADEAALEELVARFFSH